IPENVARINEIFPLDSNSLLLATDVGLYNLDLLQNTIHRIELHSNSQIQSTIFSIFKYDGKFFLAGRDGLFIYTPGESAVNHISMADGLRNNIITAVCRDNKDTYWLGTCYRVTLLNRKQKLVLNYSLRDGPPENEFNLNSYFQDNSGFYLGYPDGVIKLVLR